MDQKQGLTNNQRLFLGCGVIIILLFFLGGVGLLSGLNHFISEDTNIVSGNGDTKVALIRLDGEITEGTSQSFLSSAPYDSFSFRRQLQQLAGESDVKGILLRINSPGGSAVAAEDMYQSILEFKKTGKKVVASLGDTAASGGYYVALAADTIIASPATITGSIGVITEITDISGLYEKLGLKSETYISGPQKDMFSPTRERTSEEKAILQSLVEDAYSVFIERVGQARNLDEKTVKSMADGRVYSGTQALELQLVDKVGNYDDAVSEIESLVGTTDVSIIEYGESNFFKYFIGNLLVKQDQLTQVLDLLHPTPLVQIRYLLTR